MGATFLYSGNIFFNKFFISLVETHSLFSGNCFFDQSFFLLVETIIGNWGKHFLKKEHNFASDNQTAVSCCQWKHFLLQIEHNSKSLPLQLDN